MKAFRILRALRELRRNFTWRGVCIYLKAPRLDYVLAEEGPVWRVLLRDPDLVYAAAEELTEGADV